MTEETVAVVETTTETAKPKCNKALKITGTVAGVVALVMFGLEIAKKVKNKKAAKAAAAQENSQEQ